MAKRNLEKISIGNKLANEVLQELKEKRKSVEGKTFANKNKHDLGEEFFNKQIKEIVDEKSIMEMSKTQRLRYFFDLRVTFYDIVSEINSTQRFYNGWVNKMDTYMTKKYKEWGLHD